MRFKQFFKLYENVYKISDPYMKAIKDFIGVWKIIARRDVGTVHLGIEIDVNLYRPLSHAAGNLLGF